LQSTAAAGAIGFWSGRTTADDKKPTANERLHLGVVGVTNQGEHDWTSLVAGGAEVVAYADVDERLIGKIKERFPNAAYHVDFRKMFDAKGLDAVLVATPDHIHVHATLAALKAGLHVFCEKPLTHSVHEARLVAETAKKHNRVTQMGTQIHAGDNYRRVVELIQTGAIGPVREVHVWCARSYGAGIERPKESEPVPPGFHWDLWLGPAPDRPFHHGPNKKGRGTYHPFNWRSFWDFGGGTLNDMACHHVDLPFWALKLRYPTKVTAHGTPLNPDVAAVALTVEYEFAARGDLPPVKLTWYDGGRRPRHFAEGKLPQWGDGSLFVGEKGMLLAGYSDHKLLPEKDFEGFKRPKPFIKNSIGHYKEFVEACKNGGPTTCSFDYSGALTECVLLGNVSYRVGKSLDWDPKNLKATNCPEAERFIHKEYRAGWAL
jgi:predicted dehydrogenase